MKAEKEHIDELIVSYLSNELDGNAVHELKEWIAASVEVFYAAARNLVFCHKCERGC